MEAIIGANGVIDKNGEHGEDSESRGVRYWGGYPKNDVHVLIIH